MGKNNKYFLYAILGFWMVGCDNQPKVDVYEINKEISTHNRALGNHYFTWQAPSSWKFHPQIMLLQDAVFFAPHEKDPLIQNDHTTAQVTISFIEGMTFDPYLNVPRWQKQLSESSNEVQTSHVQIETAMGHWQFFKLKHQTKGMYIAAYENFEGTIFLKMQGPQDTLKQHAENFISLLESVKEKEL